MPLRVLREVLSETRVLERVLSRGYLCSEEQEAPLISESLWGRAFGCFRTPIERKLGNKGVVWLKGGEWSALSPNPLEHNLSMAALARGFP